MSNEGEVVGGTVRAFDDDEGGEEAGKVGVRVRDRGRVGIGPRGEAGGEGRGGGGGEGETSAGVRPCCKLGGGLAVEKEGAWRW